MKKRATLEGPATSGLPTTFASFAIPLAAEASGRAQHIRTMWRLWTAVVLGDGVALRVAVRDAGPVDVCEKVPVAVRVKEVDGRGEWEAAPVWGRTTDMTWLRACLRSPSFV